MVLGYAPFHLFLLPVAALGGHFGLVLRQPSARRAALLAFCFGFGMFGAGVSWIHVSLHIYGGMPGPLAAVATALFCGFLALFPALFGAACWFTRHHHPLVRPILIAALWVGSEWLRGVLFTGFPWLAVGYSQIPDSPLAGYAAVFGVYGVSVLVAASAATLQQFVSTPLRSNLLPTALVLCLWTGGAALQRIAWTVPVAPPFSISLLQGNINQDRKWRADEREPTLRSYLSLAERSEGELIVLPETAIPLFVDQLPPEYLARLKAIAARNKGDLIMGVVERSRDAAQTRYYNSALSMGDAPMQSYRKQHLVPFGEYIPVKPLLGWVLNILHIPLTNMSPGTSGQPALQLAAGRVAVNICFEDVFGEEIIRALPDATILVNLSNIAWFGDSLAWPQHLQISQTRALETGRYMLRSTNTGATAIIDERGRVVKQAPPFETLVLNGTAQAFTGATPYVKWGNVPVLIFVAAGVLVVIVRWWRR